VGSGAKGDREGHDCVQGRGSEEEGLVRGSFGDQTINLPQPSTSRTDSTWYQVGTSGASGLCGCPLRALRRGGGRILWLACCEVSVGAGLCGSWTGGECCSRRVCCRQFSRGLSSKQGGASRS